jgi:hypothetical protein
MASKWDLHITRADAEHVLENTIEGVQNTNSIAVLVPSEGDYLIAAESETLRGWLVSSTGAPEFHVTANQSFTAIAQFVTWASSTQSQSPNWSGTAMLSTQSRSSSLIRSASFTASVTSTRIQSPTETPSVSFTASVTSTRLQSPTETPSVC